MRPQRGFFRAALRFYSFAANIGRKEQGCCHVQQLLVVRSLRNRAYTRQPKAAAGQSRLHAQLLRKVLLGKVPQMSHFAANAFPCHFNCCFYSPRHAPTHLAQGHSLPRHSIKYLSANTPYTNNCRADALRLGWFNWLQKNLLRKQLPLRRAQAPSHPSKRQ